MWVTQHGASAVAMYNLTSGAWATFPTSRVDHADTTLPYFVTANGSLIWFNEHFGNRIAMINANSGEMTEYSVYDPPAQNGFEIDSALTITLEGDMTWFTELTGNSVGFMGAGYKPSFGISVLGNTTVKAKAGGSADILAVVKGSSSIPRQIRFSDSEDYTAKFQQIFRRRFHDVHSIPEREGDGANLVLHRPFPPSRKPYHAD